MADARIVAAACALVLPEGGALAQAVSTPGIYLDAATDDRRRGLSWSDGRPSLSAAVVAPVGNSIEVDAAIATARQSARHGGADAAVDVGARLVGDAGIVRVSGGVAAHVFPGSSGAPGWVELVGGAGALFGPLQVDLGAAYAPDQGAIGGDNLHLSVDARAGIPLTPWTLRAGLGRSTGSVDDPVRAQRLRPAGNYTNWRVGADYVLGPLTLGVDYIGNDNGRITALSPLADARHSGDVFVARAGLTF